MSGTMQSRQRPENRIHLKINYYTVPGQDFKTVSSYQTELSPTSALSPTQTSLDDHQVDPKE